MRVLVAGGTGAIGRVLVPALVAEGHQVFGFSRSDRGLERLTALGAVAHRGDVLDPDSLIGLVDSIRPAAVINQVTDLADRDLAANARARREGTANLVDAAHRAGVARFVSQSIAWVYEPGSTPAIETTPLDTAAVGVREGTVRGVLGAEEAVRTIPEHVVLRYGALYGPGTWPSRDGLFADQLRDGGFTASAGTTSFVHVADAAAAAVAALSWPAGTVNVVDDEPAAGADWTAELAAAIGAKPPAELGAAAGWERGADNALLRSLGLRLRFPTWRGRLGHD